MFFTINLLSGNFPSRLIQYLSFIEYFPQKYLRAV